MHHVLPRVCMFGVVVSFSAISSCSPILRRGPQSSVLESYRAEGRVDGIIDVPVNDGANAITTRSPYDVNITISRQGWISVDGVPCQAKKIRAAIENRQDGKQGFRFLIWHDRRCTPTQVQQVLQDIPRDKCDGCFLIHYNREGVLAATPISVAAIGGSP